jgi:hypothetical protein
MTVMRYRRHWVKQRGLTASETVYVAWTQTWHPLRSSQTCDLNIEHAYRLLSQVLHMWGPRRT